MSGIIASVFIILYRLVRNEIVALFLALIYTTVLNMLMIYGSGLLLEGWLASASLVHKLFKFPLIIGMGILVLALNFWLVLPLQNLSSSTDKPPAYVPLLIYSFLGLLLYLYSRIHIYIPVEG